MWGRQVDVLFKDREDAGRQLAAYLDPLYRNTHPLILGIPRGGVEVACYVARELGAELSLLVSKKLPLPSRKEFGIGAISEEHTVYVSPEGRHLLSSEALQEVIELQMEEVSRRVRKYRQGAPLPEMTGRTVILVDDGIATGVTLVPALWLCRKKDAAQVVIAAPVSGMTYDQNLRQADRIEVLFQPSPFYAVGQVYDVFGDLHDEEMLALLEKTVQAQNRAGGPASR
ncbi:MAG TPA: phosphoribosyltransferase family protein [Sphingobacteriaceae bacterium]